MPVWVSDTSRRQNHVGVAQWELLNHPAAQHESVRAVIAVVQPASFADTNPSNDEHLSAQWIDRMPDQDILLSVGSHDKNSGSAAGALGKPTFGVVDVQLVSAHSDSQAPFSQLAAPVTITIANHGEQTEVVTARVIHSGSEQPDEPDLVSTYVSVVPRAQSSVVMDVPAARLNVGINELTVQIATTGDSDLSDNTRSLSIQRMPRQAPYSISGVEIPDRLTPGDNALITVYVANDGQSPVAVLVDAQVDGASIANAPVSSEIINAGASGNVAITWAIPDTFVSGEYLLVVSATDPPIARNGFSIVQQGFCGTGGARWDYHGRPSNTIRHPARSIHNRRGHIPERRPNPAGVSV